MSIQRERLLRQISEQRRCENGAESLPDVIKEIYDRWHSAKPNKDGTPKLFEKNLKDDFNQITRYFIEEFKKADIKNIKFSNLKEIAGIVGNYTEEDVAKEGLLYQNLMSHCGEANSALTFMRRYMDYIAELSKLIESKQVQQVRDNLAIFPSLNADDYQCLGGTGSRLEELLSTLQSPSLHKICHDSVIQNYYLQLVRDKNININPGNEVHIKPCLRYLLGIDRGLINEYDKYFKTPIPDITVNEAWGMVREYNQELNQDLLLESEKLIKESIDRLEKKVQESGGSVTIAAVKEFISRLNSSGIQSQYVDYPSDPPQVGHFTLRDFFDDNYDKKNKEEISQMVKSRLGLEEMEVKDSYSKLPEDLSNPSAIGRIVEMANGENQSDRLAALNAIRMLGLNFKGQDIMLFLAVAGKVNPNRNLGNDEALDSQELYLYKEIKELKLHNREVLINQLGFRKKFASPENAIDSMALLYYDIFYASKELYDLSVNQEFFKLCYNGNKDSLLHIAVRKRDDRVIKYLIAKGANIEQKNSQGKTPRTLAEEMNLAYLITDNNPPEKILEEAIKGSNVEQFADKIDSLEDHSKVSELLSLAADHNQVLMFEMLLANDKRTYDDKKHDYGSILAKALQNKHFDIADKIIDHGFDLLSYRDKGNPPIFNAIAENDSESFKYLKDKISPSLHELRSRDGLSMLTFAVMYDRLNIVKELIDGNLVDVNLQDSRKNTALHYAVYYRNYDAVRYLVDKGSDIEAEDEANQTPIDLLKDELSSIVTNENDQSIKTLFNSKLEEYLKSILQKTDKISQQDMNRVIDFVEKGADPNLIIKDGNTPLHLAIINDNFEAATELIKLGAKADIQNNNGNTVLNGSVIKNNYKFAEFLLSDQSALAKSAVNEANNKGQSPLYNAVMKNNVEMARLLIQSGANLNAENKTKHTPLHLAIKKGHTEIAKLLIDKGADLGAQNSDGNTPLHLALIHKSDTTIIDSLIEKADTYIKNKKNQSPLNLLVSENNSHTYKELFLKIIQSRVAKKVTEANPENNGAWVSGSEDLTNFVKSKITGIIRKKREEFKSNIPKNPLPQVTNHIAEEVKATPEKAR